MMVKQIIPYGRTRYRVILEDGMTLLLYKGDLSRYKIAEGGEFGDELYQDILLPMLTKRAKERLVHILEVSDKPEGELRRKLRESWYPQAAVDEAVEWCKSRHYIDDERYVRGYIRNHAGRKSAKLMRYDLMERGIDRELIDICMEDTEIDEEAQILGELKKRGYREDMPDKERRRIVAALARKGYSWSLIESCIHSDDLLL